MLKIKTFTFNPFQECTYVAWDEDSLKAIIVDPGCFVSSEKDELFAFIDARGLAPEAILLTHGHVDHVLGVHACVERFAVPVYMHSEDVETLRQHAEGMKAMGISSKIDGFATLNLEDGMSLTLAGTQWAVITTPGHSLGGVCYYSEEERVIFTGDTIFKGTIGRSDLYGGDYDKLIVSIMDKVMGLPGDTEMFPGHGPFTTIADERTHNPFLEPFNEPEQEGIDWDADGIELEG